MARSVTFNGITRFRPGGITRINAEALNQVGITTGTLAIVGEADGGAPGDGSLSGLVSVRSPADATDLFRSGPLVDAILLAFQSGNDPLVPGGASEVVIYKVNQSTRSGVSLPSETLSVHTDTAAAGSTTTVVNLTTGGLTVNELVGRWVDVTLAALPGAPVYRRRITANAAATLTVTPALPAAPGATNPIAVRASWATLYSRDYGAHTASIDVDLSYSGTSYTASVAFEGQEQVSPALGGRNYLQLTYYGGANAVAADVILTPGTVTTTAINLNTGGLTVAAHNGATVVITNPATGNSEQVRIASNVAAALTLEAPGISPEFVAEIQAATASTVTVAIKGVTAALATVTGANGAATAFTTTITGVSGDNLNIAVSSLMTLRQLVDAINLNSNYVAVLPNGINGDVVLASALDFGTATATNIQKDIDVNGGIGLRADCFEVVEWLNSTEFVTAERTSTEANDGHGIIGASINDGAPVGGDYPYRLFGGTRGTSTNSNWQTAFDTLLLRPVDDVVALIDEDLVNEGNGSTATWASVAAQLAAHVGLARGAAGVERGAFIGFRGTKTEIIAAANSINDTDVQLTCQNPTVLDSTGTLVVKGPREFAVMAASMRLGVREIGEPLTGKFIRCSALTQDSSWDPRSLTDSADFIRAGILFAEAVPGRGVRWVRDLTTYVQSDNLAYAEGSVRDIVRFIAYDLRTFIEDRFTGRKAAPATIRSIKDAATARCETYRQGNLIVDSTDPATGRTIRAYHNLQVISTGDITKLNLGFFPVPGINFQLTDIYLQLPSQSA